MEKTPGVWKYGLWVQKGKQPIGDTAIPVQGM